MADSNLFTKEELLDILNDREENIINIVRSNYDSLVNRKYEGTKRLSRTDVFNMIYDIVKEIRGYLMKKQSLKIYSELL